MEILQKIPTPHDPRLSRSFKVIVTDTDRSVIYDLFIYLFIYLFIERS